MELGHQLFIAVQVKKIIALIQDVGSTSTNVSVPLIKIPAQIYFFQVLVDREPFVSLIPAWFW